MKRSESDECLTTYIRTDSENCDTGENFVKKLKVIPFPFGRCCVCQDKATGVHYGIATCEGCKGFFKRSILRQEKYRCFFGNTCVFNGETRNRCKSCRFKKCIAEGMSMEAVKMGRIPKRIKEKALKEQEVNFESENSMADSIAAVPSSVNDECENNTKSFKSDHDYQSEIIELEPSKLDSIPVSTVPLPTLSFHSSRTLQTLDTVMIPSILQPHYNTPHLSLLCLPSFFYSSQLFISSSSSASFSLQQIPSNSSPSQASVIHINTSGISTYTSHFSLCTPPTLIEEEIYDKDHKELSVAHFILKLNKSAANDYMRNCELHYKKNVISIMKNIAPKLSQPYFVYELDYEVTTFFRYLRWKMLKLVTQFNTTTRQLVKRMNTLIDMGVVEFPGSASTTDEIWAGISGTLRTDIENCIKFVHEIPAVNEICSEDLFKILNNRMFDFWLIDKAPLFYKGESYIVLINGIQYARKFMERIIGVNTVVALHEFANKLRGFKLTIVEHSLLFPIAVCVKDTSLRDPDTVRIIQYCYLYALYVQLCTTRTENEAKNLFQNLLDLIDSMAHLHELYNQNIARLSLPTSEAAAV